MPVGSLNDATGAFGVANSIKSGETADMSEGQRQRARLKKATQDFEAVFLGIMMKQMRKSMTSENALFGSSSEAKTYQEMADDQTAMQLSKTGAFGLARTLYKTMEPLLPPDTQADAKKG